VTAPSVRIEAQDEKLLAERRHGRRPRRSQRPHIHAYLKRVAQLDATTSELEERATSLELQSREHLAAAEQLTLSLGD